MSGTEDAAVIRLKRLRMRAWHRGMREMDELLGPFADRHLATLEPALIDAFEALLHENDQDLYAWISGREPVPTVHGAVIGRIRADRGL